MEIYKKKIHAFKALQTLTADRLWLHNALTSLSLAMTRYHKFTRFRRILGKNYTKSRNPKQIQSKKHLKFAQNKLKFHAKPYLNAL